MVTHMLLGLGCGGTRGAECQLRGIKPVLRRKIFARGYVCYCSFHIEFPCEMKPFFSLYCKPLHVASFQKLKRVKFLRKSRRH